MKSKRKNEELTREKKAVSLTGVPRVFDEEFRYFSFFVGLDKIIAAFEFAFQYLYRVRLDLSTAHIYLSVCFCRFVIVIIFIFVF
jgi:hypothetical protein